MPNYVRRFGVLLGLRMLFRIERTLPTSSNQINEIEMPDYEASLFLRRQVSDHATFWQCQVNNEYDFGVYPQSERLMGEYGRRVANNETVLIIDCGANVGLATLWFANRLPKATIFAIEPEDKNYSMLQRNTAPYGDRIHLLKGAIRNRKERVTIVNPEAGSAAFQVRAPDDKRSGTEGFTIDEICRMAGVDGPFIVKIDIEGGQGNLFADNTGWVPKAHLISVELDDWLLPWQGTSRPFFACLSQYPFDYLLGMESIFCFRDFEADDTC